LIISLISGIIGGGIGGTSTAYFFRQLFGKDLQIDLYESDKKLGGRAATVEIAERVYESGASILHPKNMYGKAIATQFGKLFEIFFAMHLLHNIL